MTPDSIVPAVVIVGTLAFLLAGAGLLRRSSALLVTGAFLGVGAITFAISAIALA